MFLEKQAILQLGDQTTWVCDAVSVFLTHLTLCVVLLHSIYVFLVEDLSEEGRIAIIVILNLFAQALLLALQNIIDKLRVSEILNELLVFALDLLTLLDN